MTVIDRYKNCIIWNNDSNILFIRPQLTEDAKNRKKPAVENNMIRFYKLYKLARKDAESVISHYIKYHKLALNGNLHSKFQADFNRNNYHSVFDAVCRENIPSLDFYLFGRQQK